MSNYMMKRDCVEYSYQKYNNPLVYEIRLLHKHPGNDKNGDYCEVIFNDGGSAIYKLNNSAAFTKQYGVPLSADGSIMFVCDWNKGLTAYDTRSGNELWQMKKPHIRMTLIFQNFGVTVQCNKGLIQFDLQTGDVLKTIGGGEIEQLFSLKDELALVYRYKGSACIIDCRSMTVVQTIPYSVLDPYECQSFVLLDAYVKANKVIIAGFESGARFDAKYKPQHNFERIIHEFSELP